MDDLIGIIVLILYFVIAGAVGKNKKKKKRRQQTASRRSAQFEQAFERMTSAQRKRVKESVEKITQQDAAPGQLHMTAEQEGEDPCHREMLSPERPSMYARTVAQTQLRSADEGEDPCHLGSAPELLGESPSEHSPIFDTEDPQAFARDVLCGVIMSEVLTRPAHRRYAGMKRGA